MKISLQFALVLLCGAGMTQADGYDFPNRFQKQATPKCNIRVPDLIAKYKLQGQPVPQGKRGFEAAGYDNTGKPVCPSTVYILTDLTVYTQVGYGYNKRTQREECWVDKDLNIQFVKCKNPYCTSCNSNGYEVKRCIAVPRTVTFQAICLPVRSSSGRSYAPKLGNIGYGLSDNTGFSGRESNPYRPKGYQTTGYTNGEYRNTGYNNKLYYGKIRTVKVDLPSCCQCQTFKCQ